MEILTRGKDVNTLPMVREASPVATQSQSTNGDGLLGSCRGVRAGILVVVARSDGEVHPRADSPVDGIVQSLRHTSTQRHVGNGTLVPRLPGGSILGLSSGELVSSLLSSPTPVGAQDLNSNEIDSLGNTVLARTDGTGAVGPVTIAVVVDVILRDGLVPRGTAFELGVVEVDGEGLSQGK